MAARIGIEAAFGIRVYYVNLGDKTFAQQTILALNHGQQLAPRNRSTPIEDEDEALAVAPTLMREDKLPPENRSFVSPEIGKSMLDHKIMSVVEQIEMLTAAN